MQCEMRCGSMVIVAVATKWEAIVDKVWISSRRAAEMFDVNPRTVQRWVKAGKLEGLKLDPSIVTSPLMISMESVEARLAEREQTTQ